MIKKLKPKSEFARNVITLMTGTTIAQAIPIAISPLLTRMYTPEDFGVFALYMSIVGFIGIIVNGKYDMAIILPKRNDEAFNVLILSLLITIFVSLTSLGCIYLFYEDILIFFNNKEIGRIIYFIPVSVLFIGVFQSLYYWNSRQKAFYQISKATIYQTITIGASQIGFGSLYLMNSGLIYGNIIGRLLTVIILLKLSFKNSIEYIKDVKAKTIAGQAKKYKDFPLISTFHSLSEVSRISGTVILISFFFDSTLVGFYALSLRVMQVPLSVIGSSLGNVIYQKFNKTYNADESLFPDLKTILIKLLLIAIPLFILLYLILPDLFKMIFGHSWYQAGEYSRLLIPYLFMNFIVAPISNIIMIIKKQKQFFYIGLFTNVLVLSIVYIGGKLQYPLNYILMDISIVMSASLGVMLYLLLKYTKNTVR